MSRTPAEVPRVHPPSDRTPLRAVVAPVALGLAVLLWIALVVFTSPATRGSDQYWYVEDVTTLAEGRPAETHEVYPFSLIGPDDRFEASRPFIHNGPVLHAWAALARLTGDAHCGILLGNIAFSLLAALFLAGAARRFTTPLAACLAAVGFLYVPVNFWITSQDMAEPFAAMLVALSLFLIFRYPSSLAAYIGAGAAVALASAGRLWTLPFLILLPLGLVYLDGSRPLLPRVLRALAALASGGALFLAISRAFPSYMPALDLMAFSQVAQASNNMILYYTVQPAEPFHAGVFLRRIAANAIEALRLQFSVSRERFTITRDFPAADQVPVTAMALLSIGGLAFRGIPRPVRFALALGTLAFGMNLGIASLMQNMPRYLVPLLPALVLGATAALSSLAQRLEGRRTARTLLVVVIVVAITGMAGADAINAHRYRQSALGAESRLARVRAFVGENVPAGARVVLDTRFGSRWIPDAALYPRPVLSLGTDFAHSPGEYRLMAERFDAEYALTDDTSILPEVYDLELLTADEGLAIWEVRQPSPPDRQGSGE